MDQVLDELNHQLGSMMDLDPCQPANNGRKHKLNPLVKNGRNHDSIPIVMSADDLRYFKESSTR